MQAKWWITAIATGLVALCSTPVAAQDPAQILSRSLTADATFTGEQVTEVTGGVRATRARKLQTQQVYRKGQILRVNYPNGQVMFDDGREMLLYLPRQSLIEKARSPRNPQAVANQRRAIRNGRIHLSLLGED